MKAIFFSGVMLLFLFFHIKVVSAHVVVRPNEVKAAAFQTFTISVPNEKEIATTGLKIAIPPGLKHVTPTVKNGWTIEVKKTETNVSEIIWSGGVIPEGQRDDFSFSAQVPVEATTLQWKAYQTYADGVIVAWDQPAAENHEEEAPNKGPYSETKVVEDAMGESVPASPRGSSSSQWISVLALLLSAIALGISLRKK